MILHGDKQRQYLVFSNFIRALSRRNVRGNEKMKAIELSLAGGKCLCYIVSVPACGEQKPKSADAAKASALFLRRLAYLMVALSFSTLVL